MKRFKFKSKEYIIEHKLELGWVEDSMNYLLGNSTYKIDNNRVFLVSYDRLISSVKQYNNKYIIVILKADLELQLNIKNAENIRHKDLWYIHEDAIEWLEEELTKEELNNPKLKQFIKELEEIDNI